VGTSDTARSSLRSVQKVYRTLGVAARHSGIQVVFSSVLPVKVKRLERTSRIWQINKWLQDSCHIQGFSYLGHATHFEKPDLLTADEVHLSKQGKSIFGHRLAKLVKRALN